MARPHIVLVAREVWPFMLGGGIGRHVQERARALASWADVTVVTSELHRAAHDALLRDGDPWFADPAVSFAWASDPGDDRDPRPFLSGPHAWSHACWEAVRAVAERRRPARIEAGDYRGEAAVLLLARAAGDPALAGVPVTLHAHTTWELAWTVNEQPLDDRASRVVAGLERTALWLADELLVPAEATGEVYRRAYAGTPLPPMRTVEYPFTPPPEADDARVPPDREGPLRVLFIGRLERRKGVDHLVAALRAQPEADVRLTLLGGDTPTAPGGGSMRTRLERLAQGDHRIIWHDPVAPDRVGALIRAHHVVAVPSLFESYGYVLREANAENRPVLATPVGGLVDAIEPGRSGWLTADTTEEALATALGELAEQRDAIDELIRTGAPRAAAPAAASTADEGTPAADPPAAGAPADPPAGPAAVPAALVLALGRPGDLAATLASLAAQTAPVGDVIVVADDPAQLAGADLDAITRLRHVPPGPDAPAAARAAGLAALGDAATVLVLRAGETLAPAFAERTARALASAADAAFATAYAAGVLKGRAPLGNLAGRLIAAVEASASVALFRADALRSVAGAADDLELFAALDAAGRRGVVVPEALVTHARPLPRGDGEPSLPPTGMHRGREVWEARPVSRRPGA